MGIAYCKPRNTNATGMAEINRRLAALLTHLASEINTAVAEGEITKDMEHFAQTLRSKLENEGWTFSYDGGPKLKVRHPTHPHPFLPGGIGATRQSQSVLPSSSFGAGGMPRP